LPSAILHIQMLSARDIFLVVLRTSIRTLCWFLKLSVIVCTFALDRLKPTVAQHYYRTYKYDSLKNDEIRLLLLHGGGRSDPIVFELATVKLSVQPEYEALSYVWGDPNVNEPVFLVTGQQMKATTNLIAALRRLRHKQGIRILWVDALCINQNDLDERAVQVLQMGKIYAWATQVLIWLGEETENEGYRFLGILDRVDELLSNFSPTYHIFLKVGSSPQEIERWSRIDQELDNMNVVPIIKFLERPWWRRAWVVQELVKSREAVLIWGRTCIPWQRVRKVLPVLCTQRHDIRMRCTWFITLNLLCRQAEVFQSGHHHWDMVELVWNISKFDCADPRDKVYSLLNLTRTAIRPNYRQDVLSLSKDVASYFINEQASLKILSLAGLSYQPDDAPMPSWAPQIGSRFHHTIMFFHGPHNATNLPSELPKRKKILKETGVRFEGNSMSLNAHLVDTVHLSTATLDFPLDHRGLYDNETSAKVFQDILDVALDGLQPFQRSNFEAFLATLCGGSPVALSAIMNANQEIELLVSGNKLPVEMTTEYRGDWLLEKFQSIINHWYCLSDHISGRCFGITKSGRFTLLPIKTKPGDEIVLINGSAMPHVVRSIGQDFFVLIGDCYLHGAMNGELWSTSLKARRITLN
jgi:Heterokaryon incompatibility protein (HET)